MVTSRIQWLKGKIDVSHPILQRQKPTFKDIVNTKTMFLISCRGWISILLCLISTKLSTLQCWFSTVFKIQVVIKNLVLYIPKWKLRISILK